MSALIEARSLVKSFGAIQAVRGISLTVGKGEVLGLLGPNGAGKSTTMKMLTGFLRPSAGDAYIAGINVNAEPIAAKRRFGYLPEGAPSYGDMTAGQFLQFVAAARGLEGSAAEQAIAAAVEAVDLSEVLPQTIETLSKGFRRRVGVAQAILHDPDVLILDEPTDGLDPNQKHEVRQLIARMAPTKAIVISTHLLEEVDALCSRAIVIDHGAIVADGTPAELKARSRYHGAVMLTLDAEHGARAASLLGALKGVAAIEQAAAGDGLVRVTVLADNGAALLDPAHKAVEDAGIPVHQVAVDGGRLDDVFRAITRGDRKTEKAA